MLRAVRGGAAVMLGVALTLAGCGPRVAPVTRPELRARHRIHVVQPGENLYRISLRYDVSLERLMALNRIRDPKTLQVGQELLIPGLRPRLAAEAGTPDAEPRRAPAPVASLDQVSPGEGCPVAPAPSSSSEGLLWPVDGVLLARFGAKDGQPHPGIDIGAPLGTPVWSAEAGEVRFVGERPDLGQLVVVRSRRGRLTLYARTSEVCVQVGDRVESGQGLARVGDRGGTGVPYLYFEVREENGPVDPLHRLGGSFGN